MTNLRANPDGARLRLFTSTEVAGMLKMNTQVIARKLQAGELEGYKLGKDWRVSETQLLDFLERHRGPGAGATVSARAPRAAAAARPAGRTKKSSTPRLSPRS